MPDDHIPGDPHTDPLTDPHTELATVHRLPARSDTEVVDGEIVTDADYQALTSERERAIARWQGYRADATVAVRVVAGAATHRYTQTAARATLRAALTVGQGHASWARRAVAAATHAHLREQVRAARDAGDREALAEWSDRLTAAKQARAERVRALPATLRAGLLALLVVVTLLAGLLVMLGVGFQLTTPGGLDWVSWWHLLGQIAGVIGVVATVAVHIALVGFVPGVLYLAYREGTRRGTTPRWLHSPERASESYAIINEDMLTTALANCRVTALNQALKRGDLLEYVVTPREQGGGTYVQVRLPLGVLAADFLKPEQVERLAGNLGRHLHEVYPQRQPDADARVLDLWVADQGTMDRPAPPWPLADRGEFDVFRDRLPLGVTMRGEPVEQGMLNRHSLTGASSKQGKTAFERLKFLGLALDPTVELRIADLKGDGDWSMFKPRAHTLIEGSAIEQTTATCEMLEDLVAEMQRRYDAKRAAGIKGNITRELSRRTGSGFHPIYAMVDECQVLYAEQHPIGGTKADARAWRAAKRLHDQARAVNIHLYQATQRPDDRTLPVQVREGAHVRSALYVPNHETAKMVLADAADTGARPQSLRMGRDAGTVVLTGEVDAIAEGMAFVICKSHYVTTQDAYGVIERAMAILTRHGRTVTTNPVELEAPRDFRADLDAVMHGGARERTEVIRQRLAELHPPTYEGQSARDLAAALAEAGIPIRKSDGIKVITAADLADATDAREIDGE